MTEAIKETSYMSAMCLCGFSEELKAKIDHKGVTDMVDEMNRDAADMEGQLDHFHITLAAVTSLVAQVYVSAKMAGDNPDAAVNAMLMALMHAGTTGGTPSEEFNRPTGEMLQ